MYYKKKNFNYQWGALQYHTHNTIIWNIINKNAQITLNIINQY